MIVQLKRLLLYLWILFLPGQAVFSQHSSKNNYTGAWETNTSWSPTWAVPQTNVSGYDIIINGYITVNGSLSFSGTSGNIIINDTLVIKGDLSLENKNSLIINNNGILIVRGNISIHDHANVIANGYLIVTGDFNKYGPFYEGSFTSNDNPVKVFMGGSINPFTFIFNIINFPVLSCFFPVTTPYPNSNCSHGNMTDIINDPIYPFFQSTCTLSTPTITASGALTFCAGGNVTLTSSPGISYLWSNGATTRSINVTATGSYTVKVKNASGCQSAASAATVVTVNALPVIPTITASGPTTFCAGGNVTLTSGSGTSYLWSNGANTQSIIVTTAGNYTVKITSAGGCQSAASVATIVTVNALPAAPAISAGGPTTFCAGGSVTLTSTAGTGYLWSNAETTRSINVTATGSYSVKVTNASGCQSPASAATTVTVNALPATPIITTGGPTTFCTGGSVTLTSSSGTSYLWSNAATTQSINVTTTGSYSVKVTNASGCQSPASAATTVTVNALPATPIITAGGPTTFCAGSSVMLTSSSGTSYLWSNGATTQSINVPTTGSYTVRVTNTSGCQSAASVATAVTVNPLPATPTITAGGPTTFCAGGSVTLTSSSGTSYLWSNAATTSGLNITSAGTYSVKVTNANGCQSASSAPTAVNVNSLPVVNAGPDATIPNGTSTTINATVTGTGPFTYSWTPSTLLVNASIEDPTTVNLPATTIFALTATSATTSCSNTDAMAITISGGPLSSAPKATPGIVCAGTNVQLQAIASGGSGTYTYLWTSTPSGFTSSIANPIANPTANTTYHVAVNDGFNTVNSQIIVTVNPLPATPIITPGGPTTFCTGGSVTLTSNAGSTYLWSTGATTQSINVTTAGTYTVVVKNINGCESAASAATTVMVNAIPLTPTITADGPTTFCSGGSVNLTSSAGISYLWSNGAITPTINVASTGNYSVKVINASGCQSAASAATIVTVNALPLTPTITDGGPTTFCAGDSVTLTSSAGTSYLWSNAATTKSINVITSGNYTVQVMNASGCKSALSEVKAVTVNALPVIPTITAGGPANFCSGDSITLTSSTGTSYLWSNGATTQSINVTTSGNYTVQVANASGCKSAVSQATAVTVNAIPVTPAITAGGPTTFCAGGSVTLTSSAGTSYLWSNAATTQSINATKAGNYTVKVTNSSGCQSAESIATIVTVNVLPETPTITANNPTTFCAGDDITLISSEGATYLWSNSAVTPSININAAGSYTVQVTNESGCLSAVSAPTVIFVNALPVVTAGNNGPVCAGKALNLTGSPAGMTTYYWSGPNGFASSSQNPSVSDIATLDMAGAYTLTVTNASGCSNNATLSVIVNETPIVIAGPDQELNFVFETQLNSEMSSSAETVEWSLISGSGHIIDIHSPTTRITELSIGENNFKLTVRNGSCEASAEVKIIVHDLFVPSVITPNGDGKNDNFKISEIVGRVELIIFNRWGNEEYTNGNYLNDWNGRNNKDAELPEDTYFYILKFENGKVKKGSVLIKR